MVAERNSKSDPWRQKPLRGRPGASAPKIDLSKEALKLKRNMEANQRMTTYFLLMYPKVFEEFKDFRKKYGDVSVLPTTAYFHGLNPGEEISIDIEEGKTLFIKLLHVGEPDEKEFVHLPLN